MPATTTAPFRTISFSRERTLRTALWIAQVVLAVVFAVSGFSKLFVPILELAKHAPWVGTVPSWVVRVIGACELAGAVALVIPAATRVEPRLTPLAATLLSAMMVFAVVVHISRGEAAQLVVPLVLALLAAFVAWGRYMAAPILAREQLKPITA